MRRETVQRQLLFQKVKTQSEECKTARKRPHDGAHEETADREASTCADHKCKAPPDMLTSQPVQACLREVPTDHEAHGQRSDGR